MIASEHVWCDLKDDKGKRQTVLGDELSLRRPTTRTASSTRGW